MDARQEQNSEAAFLDYLASEARKRPSGLNRLESFLAHLRGHGIRSRKDLLGSLGRLDGDALLAAIQAVAVLNMRRAGPALVRLLESSVPDARGSAQAALWYVSSKRTYRPLARLTIEHPDEDVAWSACHALSFMSDSAPAPLLLEIFESEGVTERVRAQAAEGLGNSLGWTDRRRSLFRRAANSLIRGLSDPSPEVRFWCCFALWQMGVKQAIPELARIAESDPDFCPGWWLVREEASDALTGMRGEETPSRDTLGWTESVPRVPDGFDSFGRRIATDGEP